MAGPEVLRSPMERENKDLPVPYLPILDTAEMIEEIGTGWKLPRRHGAEDLIRSWIEFCNKALEGSEIIKRAKETGEFRLNFEAFGYWNYAKRILGGNFEERTEQIKAAKRAFSALLERKEIKEMKPEDPNEARKLVSVFEERLLARATI